MVSPNTKNAPPTTAQWAQSFDISIAPTPPLVPDYDKSCPLTSSQIAMRILALQGVVATACKVDPQPIIEWFKSQGIWESTSPREQTFLLDPKAAPSELIIRMQWRQEAQWTLLWAIGKVEHLGLPTHQCDTRRMVDEIVPALGSDIAQFLSSANLRLPGELLAEDDRHYNLWCQYFQTRRNQPDQLPTDLNVNVLYQRQYAFGWLHGIDAWDDVQCDA